MCKGIVSIVVIAQGFRRVMRKTSMSGDTALWQQPLHLAVDTCRTLSLSLRATEQLTLEGTWRDHLVQPFVAKGT